jgi:hypothetical protein
VAPSSGDARRKIARLKDLSGCDESFHGGLKFSQEVVKISRRDEKFSPGGEKFSRGDEKFSPGGEKFSRRDEKFSPGSEKFSRGDEKTLGWS